MLHNNTFVSEDSALLGFEGELYSVARAVLARILPTHWQDLVLHMTHLGGEVWEGSEGARRKTRARAGRTRSRLRAPRQTSDLEARSQPSNCPATTTCIVGGQLWNWLAPEAM